MILNEFISAKETLKEYIDLLSSEINKINRQVLDLEAINDPLKDKLFWANEIYRSFKGTEEFLKQMGEVK